jgi:hypothetical protein
MSFQLSPGVRTRETDLTNVIPATATSLGAFAGYFNWGPMDEPVLVSSEKDLGELFGIPTNALERTSFFTAASFLKYSNSLNVVRAGSDTDSSGNYLNATDNGSGVLVANSTQFEAEASSITATFVARYPGVRGNSLSVVVINASTFEDSLFADQVNGQPGASEIHVLVFDDEILVEKYEYLSTVVGSKKEDGSNNFYKDVINVTSKWIYAVDNIADEPDSPATDISYTLTGGTSRTTKNVPDILAALEKFRDVEAIDVNLLFSINDDEDSSLITDALVSIVEERKDAIAFLSPTFNSLGLPYTTLNDVLDWANAQVPNTSYAVLDSSAVYMYDKYNDVYVWVPAAGHIAGLCANTDNVADAWFSPAGYNRGNLRGVVKLAFNPNKTQRDALYKARVNPLVSFPGQGTVLFGDKTALTKPSAFDRINVRRLFIVLQKSIATAAKYQLFEFNDEFTRAMFRNMTEPFLRDIQGRRGITDFFVLCDETNNTPEVIDRNEFRARIFVKPARSINFIELDFVATRTGVEFSELVG